MSKLTTSSPILSCSCCSYDDLTEKAKKEIELECENGNNNSKYNHLIQIQKCTTKERGLIPNSVFFTVFSFHIPIFKIYDVLYRRNDELEFLYKLYHYGNAISLEHNNISAHQHEILERLYNSNFITCQQEKIADVDEHSCTSNSGAVFSQEQIELKFGLTFRERNEIWDIYACRGIDAAI